MLSTTQEANDYRQKFNEYYSERIISNLAKSEDLRQAELKKWIIYIILTIFLPIWSIWFMLTFSTGDGYSGEIIGLIILVTGVCFAFSSHRVSKDFENEVKWSIMRTFLAFFGDFRWSPTMNISDEILEKSKLLGPIIGDIDPDDYFEGTYEGLKIIFSEASVSKDTTKYKCNSKKFFCGLFIHIEMNKSFESQTILIENNSLLYSLNHNIPYKFSNMEKVSLEDPEFDKNFHVFTQNQVEARYILTTAFMERFKHLKDIYKSKHIRASFLENSVLIAMDCDKDLFKLGSLFKPVDDAKEFQEFFEEFVAVLSLVDLLNLNSKTGL